MCAAWDDLNDRNAPPSVVKRLAELALAGMEAEPVAYMIGGHYLMHAQDPKVDNYASAVPLYTAPPAPVSVPAAMEMDDDFDSAFEHGKAVGWNAYRAAMLHGAEPVSNRDELTDGWVACSKRMPSPSTGVIVAAPWQSAPGGYAMKWATNCPGHPDADIDGWIIPGASWSPTHWMPLPAAPQQEDIIC
ncbi:TPA: DUF551 domain-containing protein [Escherichia coli]|nr:DUF551 domain-containing protein [Escherichia coli]